jgi:hypothetical protein
MLEKKEKLQRSCCTLKGLSANPFELSRLLISKTIKKGVFPVFYIIITL